MNSESSRKKGILVFILLFCLALTISGLGANLYVYSQSKLGFSGHYGNGIGILPIILVLIGELTLLKLVEKNNIQTPAVILVIFFLTMSMYMNFTWGINLPQSLLIYCFVIVISGLLFNSTIGFYVTLLIISFNTLVGHLQINSIIDVNLGWKQNTSGYIDVFISSITLSIIALVSWLSNREIEKSLARAEASERDLRQERDLLEIRVQQRTKELEKAQQEKILSVYRFADLGRLAAGLMHDIVNPLTVVSLNLERVYDQSTDSKSDNLQQLRRATQRAITGTQQIEKYVDAARKHIQKQDDNSRFQICTEVHRIKDLLSYRCRKEHVTIKSQCDPSIHIQGSSVRFNQCLSNIVTNALDAHALTKKSQKSITIDVCSNPADVTLTISDNAHGMDFKTLTHIFDPFFTTKGIEKGTGIGLSMTKNIIEESFHGSITVQSKLKSGTTFFIRLPK